MSRDRLSERLRDIEFPRADDALEQAVAEARAEVAGRGDVVAVRRPALARALTFAAAALLAVVFLLTPPGRAASAWVGELVGIGEVGGEPTQRYRTFGVDGSAVVIDNGTGPGGSRYEWVAYRCNVDLTDEGSDTKFQGIGLSFEWPGVKGYEGGGTCEEAQGRPRTPQDAIGGSVHIVPPQFRGVEQPDLVVSGHTGPGVHDVKVIYREPDGTERPLPVDFARVEGELRELAHRPEPMGTFVAFLDGDTAARDEIEQRLDLRALLDTGKLRLGPVARREKELALAARERCDHLEPHPSEFPKDPGDRESVDRAFKPLRECYDRHMPPSPFTYVAYDADGREVGRMDEPLITAMTVRPGDIEPAGRENPGEERVKWSDVNRTKQKPVRVMSGRAPDGALYELMIYGLRESGDYCRSIWWPYVEDAFSVGDCSEFPPEGVEEYKNEPTAARPWGFLTPAPEATAHYLLEGFARPSVSRVRVVYRTRDGERHDAPIKLKQVRGELAERIGAREPAGFWLAFIPRSAGKRPTVEVIAYDADGKIVSRIDYRA
jgi:hypothetical protein